MHLTATDNEADAVPSGAALLNAALAMVGDPVEARALVAMAVQAAREEGQDAAPVTEAGLFRLLRRAYHSIERSRPRRRMHDAAVSSIARQTLAPADSGD